MEQRTCNIIMCCKDHCKLPGGENRGSLDAVAAYMSQECACPQGDYKGRLMELIMKEALFDFLKTSDNPAFDMRQLFEPICTNEPTLSERIAIMFSLTQVRNPDGNPVNGFTQYLLDRSKIDLGEAEPGGPEDYGPPVLSDEALEKLHQEAYRKYQLHWLADTGHTAMDAARYVLEYAKATADPEDPETSDLTVMDTQTLLADWEFEAGFHGMIWVCFDEFMGAEYNDRDYMAAILSNQEFALWEAEHAEAPEQP